MVKHDNSAVLCEVQEVIVLGVQNAPLKEFFCVQR